MSSRSDAAIQCFNNSFNCSQSVLGAFCEDLGLDKEMAFKLACGFGSGMGCTGETCGAVAGAVMAIGLKYGQSKPGQIEDKFKTYALVKEFAKRFCEAYGSLKCTDLIGYDLTCPEQVVLAREKGIFKTVCAELVKKAVEITEDIL
jgi:C_GCAxxG_C_C family probable redox protein